MGYYGMPAQKRPPGARTPCEEALISIKVRVTEPHVLRPQLWLCDRDTSRRPQSMESLEILGKLLMNATVAPKEDKFRRIRLR